MSVLFSRPTLVLTISVAPFAVFLIFATSKVVYSFSPIVSLIFLVRTFSLPGSRAFFPGNSQPHAELYRNGSVLNVSRADRTISQYSRSVYSDYSRTHQSQESVTSVTSLIPSGPPHRMRGGSSGLRGSSVPPVREPARPLNLHIPKQKSWVFEGESATVTVQSGSSRT